MDFNIETYKPETAPISGKYSFNLYRWGKKFLRDRSYVETPLIALPEKNIITGKPLIFDREMPAGFARIGFFDDDWFIGARLARVLTDPFPRDVQMGIYAHSPEKWRDVTEWFWDRYLAIGRCAFDPSHSWCMQGDNNRFHYINRQMRRCNWCGQTQTTTHKVETSERLLWNDAA